MLPEEREEHESELDQLEGERIHAAIEFTERENANLMKAVERLEKQIANLTAHKNAMENQVLSLLEQNTALVEALEKIEVLGRDIRSTLATSMGNIARQALAQARED